MPTENMNNTSNPWMQLVAMQRKAFRKYQLIPLSIILVVGLLANAMVIYAGVKKSIREKYSTNIFILNLAVADLGVLLYFIPIHITEYTVGLDVSDWTCKYIIPIRETFLIVSIFSVAVLGMARFLQIHASYVFSKRVTYLIIGATWLVAYLAISMPLSFVIRHTPAMTCDHFWNDEKMERVHIGILNTIQFIPLLITTVCYLSIIRKVRNLNCEYNDSRNEPANNSRERSTLMLTLIIAAWWSLAPFLVYSLLVILKVTVEFTLKLKLWCAVAVFLTSSSAINPVLVLLMNRNYRKEVCCTSNKELATSAVRTQTSRISGKARDTRGFLGTHYFIRLLSNVVHCLKQSLHTY